MVSGFIEPSSCCCCCNEGTAALPRVCTGADVDIPVTSLLGGNAGADVDADENAEEDGRWLTLPVACAYAYSLGYPSSFQRRKSTFAFLSVPVAAADLLALPIIVLALALALALGLSGADGIGTEPKMSLCDVCIFL